MATLDSCSPMAADSSPAPAPALDTGSSPADDANDNDNGAAVTTSDNDCPMTESDQQNSTTDLDSKSCVGTDNHEKVDPQTTSEQALTKPDIDTASDRAIDASSNSIASGVSSPSEAVIDSIKIEPGDQANEVKSEVVLNDFVNKINASAKTEDATNSDGSNEHVDNRLQRIKRLKAKLINEEHRLVLMKKIRQSQTRPTASQQAGSSHSNPAANNNNAHAQSNMTGLQTPQNKKIKLSQSQNYVNPNPQTLAGLHKSAAAQLHGAVAAAAAAAHTSSTGSNLSGSNLSMNQTPAHAHQRPKMNNLWNPPPQARHPTPVGITPPHVGNMSRAPITTPPNVVQAMMGSLTGQQSLLLNQINAAAAAAVRNNRPLSQQLPQQSTSAALNQANSTLFSKTSPQMAAAAAAQILQMQNKQKSNLKPSLQKQIEQTLLQQQLNQKSSSGLNLGNFSGSKRGVGVNSPHVGNISRQPITTPPNVVQDMRGGLTGQQSLLLSAANSLANTSRSRPLQQQQLQQSSQFDKSQAAQLLLQKRTAAKTAIQKQLEQTLMQLPQKQVQPNIDFIPNANNIEFVYYIGLEACVDYLTDTKSAMDVKALEVPFECSTCGTDFTQSWSWKRSNAVCENCVANHVKKSIRNSQANRIKSVLAKAAKQEQEIDQRILAEATSLAPTSSTPASPSVSSTNNQHSLLQPSSNQQTPNRQTSSSRSSSNNNSPLVTWPRINANVSATNSPLSQLNTNRQNLASALPSLTTPPTTNASTNPLAALQPAALASLLQMNPQLSTLASLMTASSAPTPPAPVPVPTPSSAANQTNQFAQVAALLMNQLTMNMNSWNKR